MCRLSYNPLHKILHGRILIVDDDRDISMTLEMGLRLHGFDVASSNDPLSALSEFKPGSFDLALLDVRMPSMNGFELYKKLKENDPRLKVCFLTAYEASREFRELFPEMADKHFMQKPVSIKELVTRIEAILNEDFAKKV